MISCKLSHNGSAQARDDRLRLFWLDEGNREWCEGNARTPDGAPIIALVPVDEQVIHVITASQTYEVARGIWQKIGPTL